MQTLNSGVTACRYCQYYRLEGRRGGQCQQLNVPVQGSWKACQLALPPFAPSWEDPENALPWQQEALDLKRALSERYDRIESEPSVEVAAEVEQLAAVHIPVAIAEPPLIRPIVKS